MTTDDRRAFLEAHGFDVARQSFAGCQGPLWYVRELGPGDEIVGRPYDGMERKYFVDLESGRWNRWGENTWQPWERGPWHVSWATRVKSRGAEGQILVPQPPTSLIAACRKIGVELERPLDPLDVTSGIWWARKGVHEVMVFAQSRIVCDAKRDCSYPLDLPEAPVDESPPAAAKVVQRPFVSMRGQPIECSGRTVRASLF